ncbi:2110_t:CDS:1, partial [Racocetra persica]
PGKIQRTFMTDMISINGDSGAPIFSYSPDLYTVSLSGILDGGGDQSTTVTS